MSKIRIDLGRTSHKTRIWLDDVEISQHVRGFQVTAHVGAGSEVTLTLSAPAIFEGDRRPLTAAGCSRTARREVARVLLNRLDDKPAEPERMRAAADTFQRMTPADQVKVLDLYLTLHYRSTVVARFFDAVYLVGKEARSK